MQVEERVDQQHGQWRYSTVFFESDADGCAGFDLIRTRDAKPERVGRVTYWDAVGHFTITTFGVEIPASVVEGLIAEAKERIRTG